MQHQEAQKSQSLKGKSPYKPMRITRVRLNPEQAVLSCCEAIGRLVQTGTTFQCGTALPCGSDGDSQSS